MLLFSGIMFSTTDAKALSIDDAEVFLKQQTSKTCTLVSITMALRRKAILMGDSDWATITEDSVKPVAWSNGLLHNFTYSTSHYKYTVGYGDIDAYNMADITGDAKVQALAALLTNHQEGVAIYARSGYNNYTGGPHCILMTSYANGIFYVADPAQSAPAGVISIDQALKVTVENVASYWYVASVEPVTDSSTAITKSEVASTTSNTTQTATTATTQKIYNMSIKLSKTKYVYNKKQQVPTVTVKDQNGNVLTEGTDYTLSYQGDLKSIGTHKIVVTGIGAYSGYKKCSYYITPKTASIKKVKVNRKSVKVSIKKLSGNVKYQVAYRKSGKIKWTYTTTKSSLKTVKNLKSSTKYQFKVRGYKNGVYGKYSKIVNTKVK
jgi:hypothetical protein